MARSFEFARLFFNDPLGRSYEDPDELEGGKGVKGAPGVSGKVWIYDHPDGEDSMHTAEGGPESSSPPGSPVSDDTGYETAHGEGPPPGRVIKPIRFDRPTME